MHKQVLSFQSSRCFILLLRSFEGYMFFKQSINLKNLITLTKQHISHVIDMNNKCNVNFFFKIKVVFRKYLDWSCIYPRKINNIWNIDFVKKNLKNTYSNKLSIGRGTS